ncbi:MAG: hypothetical protein S4CHLAM45_13480 [Chlamydiales bacterium]|nr:hypothetical protein [Chlamydiales bacterium]MCH9623438.1 hypothetical protein [Chlamydiales bacterium]
MGIGVNSIKVTSINDELTRLWDEAQGQDQIRASLFNLIVYVKGNKKLEYFQKVVKQVVSKFPSRVIFIVSDEKPEENYLHISVDSETIGEGDLKIFCERITIEVAGKENKEQVPFLVVPQILSDLPVYLLWTQDPTTESTISPHLAPYANRIIFDSEMTADLQAFCGSVQELTNRFHCEVGDLNWSAISGWRKLLTETFNSQESFAVLDQTHELTITYCQKEHETEAAYLQAWLASRLNWKFQTFQMSEGNIRLTYRCSTHDTVVILKPEEDTSHAPGTILSLNLNSMKKGAQYTFERQGATQQVKIHASDGDKCAIPTSGYLGGTKEGQEIIEEIFYPSSKDHYLAMLQTLSLIPWSSS